MGLKLTPNATQVSRTTYQAGEVIVSTSQLTVLTSEISIFSHIEPPPPGDRCTQGEAFYRKACTPTHDKSSNADLTPTSSDGSREPVRQPRQSMSAENQPGLEMMVPPAGSSPAVLLERFRVPYIPLAVLKPARERSTAIEHFTPGECVSDRTRSRGSSMHL